MGQQSWKLQDLGKLVQQSREPGINWKKDFGLHGKGNRHGRHSVRLGLGWETGGRTGSKVKEEGDETNQGNQKPDAWGGENPLQDLQGRRDPHHFAMRLRRSYFWCEVFLHLALSWQRKIHA